MNDKNWRDEAEVFPDLKPLLRRETPIDRAPHDQLWVRPTNVTRRRVSLRPYAQTPWYACIAQRDAEGLEVLGEWALDYEFPIPESEGEEADTRDLIDRICGLAAADLDHIEQAAAELGPLRLCGCHAIPVSACWTRSDVGYLFPEPVVLWRYWARQVLAVVRLLYVLKSEKSVREDALRQVLNAFTWDNAEWWCSMKDFEAEMIETDAGEQRIRISLGRYPLSIRERKLAFPDTELPDEDRIRAAVAGRLERWMKWGDVRPRVSPDEERPGFRFDLTGDALFGAIAKHLTLVALGQEDWEICFHCHRPTRQKRRSNQKLVFCPECQGRGWPQVYRQRRYRERKCKGVSGA